MRITFFGDISLYNIDTEKFKFCKNLNALMDESDVNVGNLECPITSVRDKDESLAVTMYADSEALSVLRKFSVFSLANNHIRDFKDQGITETKEVLQNVGFPYFGVGRSQEQALEPYLMENAELKIALIGATRFANTNGSYLGTGSDSSNFIIKQIKRLKNQGYFIAIFSHWGYEYVRIPSLRERRIAHRWVDAGADIVIGSHPHIYQAIEKYKGKSIIYSLGNFIFHSSVFDGLSYIPNDPRLHESFAVSLKIEKDHSYKTEILGYRTTDDGVTLYSEEDNHKLMKEIEEVSNSLSLSKAKYLNAYYRQAYEISKQNAKVRNEFQNFKKQSLLKKAMLYRNANMQDVKNRIAAILFSVFKF